MSLTMSRQLRAARVLLGWEQEDLAAAADVSSGTIRRMERSEGDIRGHHGTVQKVQRALEEAGIEFLDGGKPGVRIDLSRARAASAAA